MEIFSIVQIISDPGSENRKSHWIIRTRNFGGLLGGGWEEIYRKEGTKKTPIHHPDRETAEKYLLDNYTGGGECWVIGNEYHYYPPSFTSF
tara:strand:+ start:328 stop:600 length:273 start_codon:yes stop_codon:yes gene_type:complete